MVTLPTDERVLGGAALLLQGHRGRQAFDVVDVGRAIWSKSRRA